MVYSNQFVASIKVDGSVLRESKGSVAIPFDSEYTVFLKNLSTVRALVKVSIDGTDITEGTWLIVSANGILELERFIKNGNWNTGNRFKFIKRTDKIEKHRGIKAEDGLIRVEYKFEKPYVAPEVEHHHHYHHHDYYPYWPYSPGPWYPYYPYTTWTLTSSTLGNVVQANSANSKGTAGSICNTGSSDGVPESAYSVFYTQSGEAVSSGERLNCLNMSFVPSPPEGDPGITVPGSESSQRFVEGAWFDTEDASHVIVLRLFGTVQGKAVKQAVTVKTKPKCATCGTANKGGVKFCKECGTCLFSL